MRRCASCRKKQTNDPTALPRVVARAHGYCICWYDAMEKLMQPAEHQGAKGQVGDWWNGQLASITTADVVAYMEQVAPVHRACGKRGCMTCKR